MSGLQQLAAKKALGERAVRRVVARAAGRRRAAAGPSNHVLLAREREADRVARAAVRPGLGAVAPVAARAGGPPLPGVARPLLEPLRGGGRALPRSVREPLASRLGDDFGDVRIHTGRHAARAARALQARAFAVGSEVVFGAGAFAPGTPAGRELMAHELAHVVQQRHARRPALDRKILVAQPTSFPWSLLGRTWKELTAAERDKFVKDKFKGKPGYNLAKRIVADMADSADELEFEDLAELETEVTKRLATSTLMQESQEKIGRDKRTAFGYPFSGPSLLYGPRVNYAARTHWEPAPPDNYALRTDKAKVKKIRELPRNRRWEVYGDMSGGYKWNLTATGKADPHEAILQLFTPQAAHKRTLIHCDYLVSLVHFRSFATAVGKAEFNRRVTAYGTDKIILRWDAFKDLEQKFFLGFPTKEIGSLQVVNPKNEADLVIGDHVYFWNHYAYDLINKKIGNAWRLENAVLIDRSKDDIFLGHGSGRKTKQQMKEKLAEEYNDVAKVALGMIAKTKSSKVATRTKAESDLANWFPNVKKVGTEWRIQGDGIGRKVDEVIRLIKPDEVLGLTDPWDTTRLYKVRRPIESD